ncbi:MAG TPA: hypothetical protein VLA71_18930 [Algoriphagus sp.]|jgi:hypothetical protein|nr:hypothetical protein [Algoriphagus sp.]
MKNNRSNVLHEVKHVSHYAEGFTSLVAGSYVMILALTKNNLALRLALGIAGGYLILRSGGKLQSGSTKKGI